MKYLLLGAILFASPLALAAGDNPYIQVGQARTKKTVIAFPDLRFSGSNADTLAKQVHEIITNDLNFMDLFSFLGSSAFVENPAAAGITLGSFKFSDWSSIQAEIVVKALLSVGGG